MSNLTDDIPNSRFEESQAIEGNVHQTAQEEGPPEVPTGEHFPAEHKQVNEEPIFSGQFTYRDYLFDTNSDSTELQPGPSSATGESLLPQASLPVSTTTTISLQPLTPSSSGPIVNFGLDHSEHQLHFAEHQGQQATDFLSSPSAIVGASDSLPSNEFMLFDTSMLDTSTDLSAMQETSGTATATSKVVEYFTSPPPLQSSLPQDLPAMGSMSQQLSLESDHAQPQAQLHESDNFVHFHRINGNGVTGGHSDSQVPPNDTNNNPVSEVNEDLKESINNMLVESAAMATSMSDPVSTSNTMDIHLTQQQQQQANQYINSNMRQMLDSTNSNNSTTVMDTNGPSHVMMSQELASHPQQMTPQQSLDSQPPVSNEPQANMLNMIPDAYTCFSNEPQMQHDTTQNFPNNESSMTSQQSQSGQEGQSHGPVSNESSLYHSHHHSLQQLQQTPSQQQTSQQQQQQQQQQQPSAQHHLSSSSMSVVAGQGNQTNQQMNHHGQSMSHHHLPQHHHSMVANASSTPAMEYGQSQLMPSQSPSMDTGSNNNSSTALQQQQQQQQQQTSQSTNSSSVNQNVASVDTMMSQNASLPQTSSVSSNSENKSESASYGNSSADYLLQSAHAPSAQYHHSIHHSEGQMFPSSSSSTSTSLSSSTASPHSLPPLPNTAHQRTHYMPSNENILTSSSNVVNQSAGANINNNTNNSGNSTSNRSTSSSEPGPSTASPSTSANSQILTQFETIDTGSVPSSTLNQQNRSQYVLIKCDPSAPSLTYQEGSKTHQSVQQMQYDVSQQQQSQSMQSRLSLNEPNTSTSGAIAIQVQQAQPPQQPHLLNSVGGQQGASVEESSQGQSRPHPGTPLNLPPNSQNSQICISLANNAVTSSLQSSQVPTVTLAGMPSNSNGLRPVCVITDPNVASLPPLHQTTQQAQVNLATFHNLPPKKIRFPNVSTNIISPGSSSLSQSTAPALLFASKSSVMPSVPQSQMSHQPQQPQQAQASNVVQAMIVPSNLSFNQAQPIQSQNVGNILTSSSSSSTPNLQNVAAKPFVPSSGNTEQNYPQTEILMQRHYTPSSVPPSSTSTSVIYQPSEGSSSIQSGSQFNRLPNVSTAPNVASSQAQIFFNSASPHTADIRFLNNYSILSLQPASIQQGQQNQTQANKNQMLPHKILLTHSVPVTDGSHPSGNHSLAPAATALISLNPDFALSSNPGQVALGHLPTLNNGPSSGGANNSGKPGHSLSSGSIILSPIIHNSNIPGSQVTRTVTNFAVPIPVVTSAIGSEHRHQNVTIQFSPASQFATSAFSPNVSQPTIISNLVPSTGAHTTALATKSTKMPSSQANKTASKSGNSSTSSKGASGNSGSSSSSGSTSKGINPPPLMSDDPAKPFKCCLCGKNLASKNVYQLHLRSHSGEKPFVCHLCNNRFSQKTSLTRHMRSHTGERPFPCQVCNKRFADKERIKIHMRIHTGEKPFSCGVCGKKFSQKSTVKRHMSVHTGVKPFKCDVCGKGFANRGNLTAHTKTHQPQQQAQQQQSRSSSLGTMTTSSNNNHQQAPPQTIQQHQMSIELQTQMAASSGNHQSMPGANIVYATSATVSSNGSRIEISNIKTESDDVMIETKSSLVGGSSQANNNPHNHQFTSATMPQPPQPSKPLSS